MTIFLKNLLNESNLYGLSIKELLDTTLQFKNKTLIYFDTETMGLNPSPKYSQLTEVAAIAYDGNTMKEISTFNYKVNLSQSAKNVLVPGTVEWKAWNKQFGNKSNVMTPADILKMTRYDQKTAEFLSEMDVLINLFKFIDKFKNPILVAHNASFDMKYIMTRAKKYYGIKPPKYSVLDTLKLSKLFFIPLLQSVKESDELAVILTSLTTKKFKNGNTLVSSRLGHLSKALNINNSDWHSALADVRMLFSVLSKMIYFFKKYKNVDISALHTKAIRTFKRTKTYR